MKRIDRQTVVRLLLLLTIVWSVGCGRKGPPLPPEPRGPNPPQRVDARQIGERGYVTLQLGEPRGTKPNQAMQSIELIRVSYEGSTPPPVDPDAFRRRGELVASREATTAWESGRVELLVDPTSSAPADEEQLKTRRYAVRVLDLRGRPSVWVAAPDLILLPSGSPPQQLVAEPTADGVRLRWEGENASGYHVYRAAAGSTGPLLAPLNRQPLLETEYLDSSVTLGQSYRYEVRALLADGPPLRESASATVGPIDAIDRFAPAPPTRLVAVQEGAGIRLFWDPAPERDVAGYLVFRSVDGGPFEPLGEGRTDRPLYLDADVQVGQSIRYRVITEDNAQPPNRSQPAETTPLTVVSEP